MSARYMTADDVADAFADERRQLAAEYEAEISELRAEVETLKGLLADANAAKERYAADAEHARQTLVEQVEHGRERLAGAESARDRYAQEVAELAPARARLRDQVACYTDKILDLEERVKTLSPMSPIADVLHAELLRSDVVEFIPEVPGHSPEMLRIGRMVLSGMSAGALFEALRGFCLDFTDDKED